MKKSIYKITGWSLAISAAVVFGISRNNQLPTSTPAGQGYISNTADNNSTNGESNTGGVVNYQNDSYASNTEQQNGLSAGTITSTQSSSNTNQGVASTTGTGVGMFDGSSSNAASDVQNNYTEASNNQDALAKGGPNSNEYSSTQQQYNNTTTTGGVASPVSAPSSSSASPVASARISAPTVVTAPPSPSSGGGGAGDPFVPIDDYYGLIFLIAVSTVVGIFTIKKSKVV